MKLKLKLKLTLAVCEGVKFMPQSILDVNPDDSFWKKVKSILILAPCSKSAIHNPVDWIVNDNEDLSILAEFSPSYTEELRNSRQAASIALSRQVLTKAMKCTFALALALRNVMYTN